MKRSFLLLIILTGLAAAKAQVIDLSGTWQFAIDRDDVGRQDCWQAMILPDNISLPGSMLTNGLGDEVSALTPWMMHVSPGYYKNPDYDEYRQPGNVKIPFTLQPNKYYAGAAWYQREVVIPKSWRKRCIQLFMERCHWLTELYVDGRCVGTRNDLCAPQRYDLTQWLSPGCHILTLRVDNRIGDIDPGLNSHSISDNTQGNWNGVAGRVELEARPRVWLSHVAVHPKFSSQTMTVKAEITNTLDKPVTALVRAGGRQERRTLEAGTNELTMTVPLPAGTEYWDEFHPNLYELEVSVRAKGETDTRSVRYGCREWDTSGGRLMLNGHPVAMRGNVDCCTFPLTGFPSFERSYWQNVFRVYKNYGLNHVRFHSWCPPEVAFQVADEMGIYCYVEASSWANQSTTLGDGKGIDRFIYQESEAIIREYGNHPSFCMFSYGNEPGGANSTAFLRQFVNYWKQRDDRFLYTAAAGWPNIDESDWFCDPSPRIQAWGGGLNSIINARPPSTTFDWGNYTQRFSKPIVSHEIGQWCVYPNFHEIEKYTGVYKARNFEIFRDRIRRNGLGELADSFLLASGKLQVLCYKADIEAALRTRDFGGFELLGLNDFSGQGTALTGVVDVFWDDKGYVTGSEYSRFCNSLVPLARMEKLVFTSDETMRADVEVANYRRPMGRTALTWNVFDADGKCRREGQLTASELPLGNGISCGRIELPLAGLPSPTQYRLEIRVGDEAANDWHFWVYEANTEDEGSGTAGRAEVVVTSDMAEVEKALERGRNVLLSLGRGRVRKEMGGEVAVGFSSIFWNTFWTNGQPPHTLGLLCDPGHPALREFPTQWHSDYQWQDAMSHCDAIRYDLLSPGIKPIVRIIDDWFTARPLALVFEVCVGKGKLLVCGADLYTDLDHRPAARQLRRSLVSYMRSPDFRPAKEVSIDRIRQLTD